MEKTWLGSEMLLWINNDLAQKSFVAQCRSTALDRSYESFNDFINSNLTWANTTEGIEFWRDMSRRNDTPDYVDVDGEQVHISNILQYSEHSSRAGESTTPGDLSCAKCVELCEWFELDELQTVVDEYGNHYGYISNHWLEDGYGDYVITHEGELIHVNNAILAEGRHEDVYFPSRDIGECVKSDRDDKWFISEWVANHFDYYFRDHVQDYLHIDDEDFDEPDEEQSEDAGDYNAGYHNLNRTWKTPKNTKFTVGFEIEKEDNELACRYHYQDLYNRTEWCKERDGSLDDNSGYELVSPVLDLFTNQLEVELKDEAIRELINAEYCTSTCGGHINLGSSEYSPEELFEGMSAFYPLLYAMYPYRISKSYSKAKKKHEYYQREKYSAIYMRGQVLEFRIFSGVKNVDQLIWRRDLIRIFCDNINKSESDVLRMLIDHRSKLYKHLRKVYSQETLIDKTELFINHVREWNNKKLPAINREQLKKDNIIDNNSENQADA